VKGAYAGKTACCSNIDQRKIAFRQHTPGVVAAQMIDIAGKGTADALVENMRKTACTVTEMRGGLRNSDGFGGMFLKINEDPLNEVALIIGGIFSQADAVNQKSRMMTETLEEVILKLNFLLTLKITVVQRLPM
jgi:hypothetical protein